jgi:hypothetical protein
MTMRTLVPLSLASAAVLGLAIAQVRAKSQQGAPKMKAITIRREPDDVESYLREVGHIDHVRVSPAPGGRGSELRIQTDDGDAPDLRELKQVLETGEIIRSDATLERTDLLQRHAQPMGAQA